MVPHSARETRISHPARYEWYVLPNSSWNFSTLSDKEIVSLERTRQTSKYSRLRIVIFVWWPNSLQSFVVAIRIGLRNRPISNHEPRDMNHGSEGCPRRQIPTSTSILLRLPSR